MALLNNTEDGFRCGYGHQAHAVRDGLLWSGEEKAFTLEAVHNHHLPYAPPAPYLSFSFRIGLAGKSIFYSGDTSLEDLADTVPDYCDLMFMETGHHQIPQVCRFPEGCRKKYPYACIYSSWTAGSWRSGKSGGGAAQVLGNGRSDRL